MSVWFLHVGKTDFVYDVPFICTEKAGIRHHGKVHTARVHHNANVSIESVIKCGVCIENEWRLWK